MTHLVRIVVLSAMASSWCAKASAQDMSSTNWRLVEIREERIPADAPPTLSFAADGSVSGDGGCNQFKGRFVTNGNSILLSPLASTMMICEDAISDRETLFLSALQEARQFETDDTKLVLKNVMGEPILALTVD